MESLQQRMHREQLDNASGRVQFDTDDRTMTVRDQHVRFTLTTTDATCTLPSVSEARGKSFRVELLSTTTATLTIQDKSNDAHMQDVQLGVAGVVDFYSTGTFWVVQHPQDSKTQVKEFDDFNAQLTEAASNWILNSGADAQAIDPAINAQASGVIRLTSGDADGTMANDGSQMVGNHGWYAQDGGLYMEARVKCVTNIATMSVCVGFTDSTSLEEAVSISGTTITTTASDAATFVYDSAQTTDQWYCVAVDGDTDDTGNAISGVAPTTTWQVLRIEISKDGATIRFYIDGVLVKELSGAAGVSPDVALYPNISVCSTTTTSKSFDVDYVEVGCARQ